MESWMVALGSAVVGGSITVVGWSIWAGRNVVTKDDLDRATADTANEIRELRNGIDSHERNVGETILGIRQKINEVELYVRDTFVRRDSWHAAMGQMQERWAAGEKAAEERALRLETKVDRIIEGLLVKK